MLQYDPKCRLNAEEISRHHLLTRDCKDFTKININEVRDKLTEDGKLEINVKQNQSIWAIFNNKEDLDDVPGYILEKNEKDKYLAPIAEFDNLNLNGNNNNNMNNNQNNNINNNINNSNPNQMNNNNRNNNYNNYYMRQNHFQYPNYNPNAFRNNLVNKNMNYQPNNMANNAANMQQNHNQNSTSPKIDLKEFLMKSFYSINEDFLILNPVFIPLIPGDDPEDKFNDEEHL